MHNKKELQRYRKALRNNATSAEAYLWKCLSNRKLDGRKFRRQHSINNFIVDFFCPQERLIIELDGDVHMNTTVECNDLARDFELSELNYQVLRFENKVNFENLSSVLAEIRSNFKQ